MNDVVRFGSDLCKALGIDPIAMRVCDLTLNMHASELPVATITRYVVNEAIGEVTKAVDRYELHPVLVSEPE